VGAANFVLSTGGGANSAPQILHMDLRGHFKVRKGGRKKNGGQIKEGNGRMDGTR